MSASGEAETELEVLCSSLCDDNLTEEQARRLDSLLEGDTRSRLDYLRYMHLQSSLYRLMGAHSAIPAPDDKTWINHLLIETETAPEELGSVAERERLSLNDAMIVPAMHEEDDPEEPVSPAPHFEPSSAAPAPGAWQRARRTRLWSLAAAVLLTVAGVAWWAARAGRSPAILAGAIDARWEGERSSPRPGQALSSRPMALASGLVKIDLRGGAVAVVQGPARFTLDSPSNVTLLKGRITAHVPAGAVGFAVHTPSADVTDLGTEFGVSVESSALTRSEVFVGRVSVALAGGENARSQIVSASEAVEVNSLTGSIVPEVPDPVSFVRPAQFAELQHAVLAEDPRFTRWRDCSKRLRNDPAMEAYYAFDNEAEASDLLLNRASATSGSSDGQIEHAVWTDGRFPGKRALRFNGTDARVKVVIPSKLPQMTLALWVDLERRDRTYAALLDSSGDAGLGGIHVQSWKDTLNFGLRTRRITNGFEFEQINSGLAVFKPAVGRWRLVAATYDSAAQEGRWYLDGRPAGIVRVPNALAVIIGTAELGNFSPPPNQVEPERGLVGCIDEVAVFKRALTPLEIQQLFEAGNID